MAITAVFITLAIPIAAFGSQICIGGCGSCSTDYPDGPEGLLSGGETATATLEYALVDEDGVTKLILTITNTSPACCGTESPDIEDAPVISDVMFCAPGCISSIALDTVQGEAAADTGWEFEYDPNALPSSGFGFLKGNFDAFVEGGPPGNPAPVIGSIYDPCITDGPGKPTLASPVEFVFTVEFCDGITPAGFCSDWFVNKVNLGSPEYVAAAHFMSGANGGSSTVTSLLVPVVPEPASILLVLCGMAGVAFKVHGRRRW